MEKKHAIISQRDRVVTDVFHNRDKQTRGAHTLQEATTDVVTEPLMHRRLHRRLTRFITGVYCDADKATRTEPVIISFMAT